jgi:hypothetical protein
MGLGKTPRFRNMIQAQTDKTNNLLRVTYAQRVEPAEMQRALEDLRRLLADMETGFRLLTDLSGLEEMDLACEPAMKTMMDLCDDKGVQTVVRVIPNPQKDIGLNIMSLFHYQRRVRIVTCATLEEALNVLGLSGSSVQNVVAGKPPVGPSQARKPR